MRKTKFPLISDIVTLLYDRITEVKDTMSSLISKNVITKLKGERDRWHIKELVIKE